MVQDVAVVDCINSMKDVLDLRSDSLLLACNCYKDLTIIMLRYVLYMYIIYVRDKLLLTCFLLPLYFGVVAKHI